MKKRIAMGIIACLLLSLPFTAAGEAANQGIDITVNGVPLEEVIGTASGMFTDAVEENMGEMIDRKVRELKDVDLETITNTYHTWLSNNGYEDKKGYCKSASLEEIREADYTLVPGRYVGIDDSNKMSEEEIDAEIKKVSAELLTLFEESKELEEKVIEILKANL